MTHTTRTIRATAALVLLAGTFGCVRSGQMDTGTRTGTADAMSRSGMTNMMSGWHPVSREAAMAMMEKYGEPAVMNEHMAMWMGNGPWKKTVVFREAVPHNFPMPHMDVLEQFVDYQVPPAMYDELAMYDGSVMAERTKGELSARCDKEAANFLALNLAHEIVTGTRTVQAARMKYLEEIKMAKAGNMTQYTSGLMFTPARGQAGDPDHPPTQSGM